jgi:hypothetical protein
VLGVNNREIAGSDRIGTHKAIEKAVIKICENFFICKTLSYYCHHGKI